MISIDKKTTFVKNSLYKNIKVHVQDEENYTKMNIESTIQLIDFRYKYVDFIEYPFKDIEKLFARNEIFPNGMRQNEWHEILGWSLSMLDLLHIQLRLMSEVVINKKISEFILDMCMTIQNIMLCFSTELYLTIIFEVRKLIESFAILKYIHDNDESQFDEKIPFKNKLNQTVDTFSSKLHRYYVYISNLIHFVEPENFPGIAMNRIYVQLYKNWDRNTFNKDLVEIFNELWDKTTFLDEVCLQNDSLTQFVKYKKILMMYRRSPIYDLTVNAEGLHDNPYYFNYDNGSYASEKLRDRFLGYINGDIDNEEISTIISEYKEYLLTGVFVDGKSKNLSQFYKSLNSERIVDLICKIKEIELNELDVQLGYLVSAIEEVLMSDVSFRLNNAPLFYFIFSIFEKGFGISTPNSIKGTLIKYKHVVHEKRALSYDFAWRDVNHSVILATSGMSDIGKQMKVELIQCMESLIKKYNKEL